MNQFQVDMGGREPRTIQIGVRNPFEKEMIEHDWGSSDSELDDDTPDLESRSDDSLKRKQKLAEERMNKTIAKHQNCKKVQQL
jgi:hypothetical protein